MAVTAVYQGLVAIRADKEILQCALISCDLFLGSRR